MARSTLYTCTVHITVESDRSRLSCDTLPVLAVTSFRHFRDCLTTMVTRVLRDVLSLVSHCAAISSLAVGAFFSLYLRFSSRQGNLRRGTRNVGGQRATMTREFLTREQKRRPALGSHKFIVGAAHVLMGGKASLNKPDLQAETRCLTPRLSWYLKKPFNTTNRSFEPSN